MGFLDLWCGQKPWWKWYLTSVVNFGEVWRAQLAKSTLLTSMSVPLGSLRSVEILKREWDAESNRKLPLLFIYGITVALVLEFAVEDLPSAELQPWFLYLQWKTCPWAEHSDDDMDVKLRRQAEVMNINWKVRWSDIMSNKNRWGKSKQKRNQNRNLKD